MMTNQHASCKRREDRGVTILIVAVSMIFVLGMAGLGIDLASLYVARSQAQRAADAAALAGANYVALNCTSAAGGTIDAGCQAVAIQQAEAIGNQNLIAGVSPKMGTQPGDVQFLSTSSNDPIIQAIASRDATHGNPMPTFFVKIFGINTANVSAKAEAEAYNPSGGLSSTGAHCLKPWLMPNCDWDHSYSAYGSYQIPPQNANCFGSVQFTQATANNYNSQASSMPVLSADLTQGEQLLIKSSDPSKASGPSKFYPVYLPINSNNLSCPSCAKTLTSGGTASGALYSQNIACCNKQPIECGAAAVQPITGNMVGPTANGVDCLIHQNKGGGGQDTFSNTASTILGTPWTITAGANNPYVTTMGPIGTSDSVVTIPLYDGTPLCPGGSCGQTTVYVTGFLQLFIEDEQNGNVTAYVMNVIGCPNSPSGGPGSPGGGGGGPVVDTGTPIAVRLIQ